MSQPDFANELINQSSPTGRTQLDNIIRRDRRRIRSLAAAMIGLWLLAALLIPAVLLPMWAKVKHHEQNYSWGGPERKPADELTGFETFKVLAIVSTFIAAVSTSASLVGAICTVWLVLTVRRTTLHQINAGLSEISDQLRRLDPGQA